MGSESTWEGALLRGNYIWISLLAAKQHSQWTFLHIMSSSILIHQLLADAVGCHIKFFPHEKSVPAILEQDIVSGSGISWATCKSAPCPSQITTPASHHSVILQATCPSSHPTNSVKALKAKHWTSLYSTVYTKASNNSTCLLISWHMVDTGFQECVASHSYQMDHAPTTLTGDRSADLFAQKQHWLTTDSVRSLYTNQNLCKHQTLTQSINYSHFTAFLEFVRDYPGELVPER